MPDKKQLYCVITFISPEQYIVNSTTHMDNPKVGCVIIHTDEHAITCYITNRRNDEDVIDEALVLSRDRHKLEDYLSTTQEPKYGG